MIEFKNFMLKLLGFKKPSVYQMLIRRLEIFYEKTSRNSIQEKPLFQFFFQVLFLFLFLFQNCKKRWTTSQVFSLSSSSPLKYQLYIYEKISTNLLNITCNDFLPSIMFNREVKQLSKRNVSHTVFFSVHS